MKQMPVAVIAGCLLLVVVGYKLLKRYYFFPKMTFRSEQLTRLDNGEHTNIDALKGNVLIVSCYQTWCGDCARETPVLNDLATAINSPQFKVIYISNEPAEKVNRFKSRFESGKILFTKTEKQPSDLGIRAFPSTFLLDKKGKVILTKLEGYDWRKEEKQIRQLLAE